MAGHAVGPWKDDPLPGVIVIYSPETETLGIQAGAPARIHESETVAHGMVAHYDKHGSLVAIDMESAELLLKPFLDAVLQKEKEKTIHGPGRRRPPAAPGV